MKKPINQWLAFIDMKGELLEMAKKESKIIEKICRFLSMKSS